LLRFFTDWRDEKKWLSNPVSLFHLLTHGERLEEKKLASLTLSSISIIRQVQFYTKRISTKFFATNDVFDHKGIKIAMWNCRRLQHTGYFGTKAKGDWFTLSEKEQFMAGLILHFHQVSSV
jgi:hypothetical protein